MVVSGYAAPGDDVTNDDPSPKFQLKVGVSITPTVIPRMREVVENLVLASVQKYIGTWTSSPIFGAKKIFR